MGWKHKVRQRGERERERKEKERHPNPVGCSFRLNGEIRKICILSLNILDGKWSDLLKKIRSVVSYKLKWMFPKGKLALRHQQRLL